MSDVIQKIINGLSKEEVADIEAEVAHMPDRQAGAIDALKIVQSYRGWISDASLAAIARLLDMSIDELDGVATFYNLIYRQPVGDKVVLVCDGVSCWVMGGDKIQDCASRTLGIGYGETTPDGRYTLLPVTCLGDCDHAPALMIGDELHHDLTLDTVESLLNGKEKD